MESKDQDKVTLSCRLLPEQKTSLQELAEEQGLSLSNFANEILANHLNGNNQIENLKETIVKQEQLIEHLQGENENQKAALEEKKEELKDQEEEEEILEAQWLQGDLVKLKEKNKYLEEKLPFEPKVLEMIRVYLNKIKQTNPNYSDELLLKAIFETIIKNESSTFRMYKLKEILLKTKA